MNRALRIVIADDSILVRKKLVSILRSIRDVNIVGEAANGLEALDAVRRLCPDVLILDLRMPVLSGIGVLERLRGCAHPPEVMVLTLADSNTHRKRCAGLGAKHFINKLNGVETAVHVLGQLARRKSHGSASEAEQTKQDDN